MKIAFITRSTLYDVPGGDTVQVTQLAKHLKKQGAVADIFLTNHRVDYAGYDLFYFTNIISGTLALVLLIVAGVLFLTAVISFCPLYFILHLNSSKKQIQ